jgi:hypothetical protein
MPLPPKLIGPMISAITGLITSTSMSFVGLALNYGFQPDFAMRWLKAAATSYIVIPPIQRFVMRQAGLPPRQSPGAAPKESSGASRVRQFVL